MEIEKLFSTAVGEIERILNTKTVIGEPMTVDGNTLIPLVSVGFGFGAGGGTGGTGTNTEGSGGGTGGGGGVKPLALVVVNRDGVHVERIERASGAMQQLAASVGQLAARDRGERGEKKGDKGAGS